MIETIFLNFEGDLDSVSKSIFNILDIQNVLTSDSKHVAGEEFKIVSLLGINIRLEKSDYDWDEGDYNYMVIIRQNLVSKRKISSNSISKLRDIICDLLFNNLQIPIAIEINGCLKTYPFLPSLSDSL